MNTVLIDSAPRLIRVAWELQRLIDRLQGHRDEGEPWVSDDSPRRCHHTYLTYDCLMCEGPQG